MQMVKGQCHGGRESCGGVCVHAEKNCFIEWRLIVPAGNEVEKDNAVQLLQA